MTRRSFLGLLLTPAFAPSPRVSFVRPPKIATDQFRIPIYIRVPLYAENRTLAIAAFEGDFRVQYSEKDLSLETRRTLWDVSWQLPAGEILIIAALYGRAGELDRATHTMTVIRWGI